MGKHFENLIAQVKKYPMKKLSVAAAADSNVLSAVKEAKEKGKGNLLNNRKILMIT